MTDQSAKLASFLHKIGPDADLSEMQDEFMGLFPGITREEWMRGFAIHDECILIDAAVSNGKPIDLQQQMAAIGWNPAH